MKTILWIYNHPLRPEAGGTERITSLVMRGLSAKGHKCMGIMVVDVANKTLEYDGNIINDLYNFLKDNKVDTVINQCGHTIELLDFFLNRGGEQWHNEGGKIISCLHFHPKPTDVYYEFLSKKNKNIHDYYVIGKSWLIRSYLRNRDKTIIGRTYKKIYDNSYAYVILSEKYTNYMIEAMQIKDTHKLYSINNPLTFEQISSTSLLSEKKQSILVVGRLLDWQKRIMLCIKAWKLINNNPVLNCWNLKIVGTGEDYDYYKEYIEKHNIERISLEGQQSPEPYYEEAKIFLMTSKMEGWGLTLTESLQRGVVPIVFNTSEAFSEIITDGYNGFLVKEGDMRTFCKRIEQLTTDEELWFRMANNALESAQKFNLDNTIKKWEEII